MGYYRNKLYIAFDGDEDMTYFNTLKMWNSNKDIDFDFYDAHDLNSARDSSLTDSIKAQLRERMKNSKTFLLLVGAKTKNLRKFIPWEIEYARHLDLPIVVANLNGRREYDATRCPSTIERGNGAIHVSFQMKIIRRALAEWPEYYRSNKPGVLEKPYHYPAKAYQDLGI